MRIGRPNKRQTVHAILGVIVVALVSLGIAFATPVKHEVSKQTRLLAPSASPDEDGHDDPCLHLVTTNAGRFSLRFCHLECSSPPVTAFPRRLTWLASGAHVTSSASTRPPIRVLLCTWLI